MGDTLQFVRYIKLAAERCDKIIVAAPQALMPLLAQSGFSGLVSKDQPLPTFDVHVPLLSLPGVFGTGRTRGSTCSTTCVKSGSGRGGPLRCTSPAQSVACGGES